MHGFKQIFFQRGGTRRVRAIHVRKNKRIPTVHTGIKITRTRSHTSTNDAKNIVLSKPTIQIKQSNDKHNYTHTPLNAAPT